MKNKLAHYLGHPYFRAANILLLFILPASLIRITLYFFYLDDFQNLTLTKILVSLLIGLRFDISMAAMLIGIPLLLLLLPFHWSRHRYWQRLWGGFIYIVWLLFIALMMIDTIYFGNVHRHIGSEINTLSNDMMSMFVIAITQYRSALSLFAMIAFSGAYVWWHLFDRIPVPPARLWKHVLLFPLLFFLMLLAERGGYTGQPIGVGDAFFSESLEQGYLAMNGAFAASRAWVETTPRVKLFMPQQDAVAETQLFLSGNKSKFLSKDYPLLQNYSPDKVKNKPNVVVLMLESWGAHNIDTLRQARNLPALGATPNFDHLTQQGRLFTNFYANGQRSMEGASAILASQPTFHDMPMLGLGMEQNRSSFMGQLAHSQGYKTIFLQSSDHGSFHFDAIATRSGFSQYLGAEEIPNLHEHPKQADTWGTWDHNTFQQANKLFSQSDKPFIGFIFTSTTHNPWLIPDARWNKFTGGTKRDAFLNSLYYADWALGQLMDAAKQAGYFDNTIFVITADHTDEFVEDTKFVPNLFQIPLLLIGPGIKPGTDLRLGSQLDILPTLIDLCGWTVPFAGLGRSLMDETRTDERASLSVQGWVLDWITPDGWVSHNLTQRVGKSKDISEERATNMEKHLLGFYQTAIQLQISNHLLPAGQN